MLRAIADAGVDAIAICTLFSFVNPDHERRLSELAGELAGTSGLHRSVSHEVLPEHREFERMSTTVANAYVAPAMTRYLSALEAGLADAASAGGAPPRLRIMQSNGGSISAAQAGRDAVRTVLSGPAGGVAGAFEAARASGLEHAITFDMGGTSTDVSLCPGRILERGDHDVDGMPIRTPAVDVHTVGAGGGSIAWIDDGGALRVGPQSAGADPGPAAYGRGELPAVTDAHVVLGRLRPDRFLGGGMALHPDRAERALATIAPAFGGDVRRAARAVIEVVNANMVRALRLISVERGFDPAEFALVAFGGAGPLHACEVAAELGVETVIVPAAPGVLSASGMLHADVTKDLARGLMLRVPASAVGDARPAACGLRGPRCADAGGARGGRLPARRAHRAQRRSALRGTVARADGPARTLARRRGAASRPRRGARGALRPRRSGPRRGDRRRTREGARRRLPQRGAGEPRARRRPRRGGEHRRLGPATPHAHPRPAEPRERGYRGARDPDAARHDDARPAGLAGAARPAGLGQSDPERGRRRAPMSDIDPARLAIFDSLVSSAAEEMGATLRHTALSPNIKERQDYSCAVFDAAGQPLAQAAHIPVHLGAMPESVRAVESLAPWAEGDIAILNDPYLGGTHLPDVTMVSPVFAEEGPSGPSGRPPRYGAPDRSASSPAARTRPTSAAARRARCRSRAS